MARPRLLALVAALCLSVGLIAQTPVPSSVTVVVPPPAPSVAISGISFPTAGGATISARVTGKAPGPVEFLNGAAVLGSDSSSPYSLTVSKAALVPGTYDFRVRFKGAPPPPPPPPPAPAPAPTPTPASPHTAARANSYDDAWQPAWIAKGNQVLATAVPGITKTRGKVVHPGDSISRSQAYGAWCSPYGLGKTAEDVATSAFMHCESTGPDNGFNYLGTSFDGMGWGDGRILAMLDDPTINNAQFAVLMFNSVPDLSIVESTLTAFIAKGIVPVVSTVPPRINAGYDAQSTIPYNTKLRALAQKLAIPLIDFYAEVLARRPGTTFDGTLIGLGDVHPTGTNSGVTVTSDPYTPGGNAATQTTGDALLNSGYLLRTWLTVQKVTELRTRLTIAPPPPPPPPSTTDSPSGTYGPTITAQGRVYAITIYKEAVRDDGASLGGMSAQAWLYLNGVVYVDNPNSGFYRLNLADRTWTSVPDPRGPVTPPPPAPAPSPAPAPAPAPGPTPGSAPLPPTPAPAPGLAGLPLVQGTPMAGAKTLQPLGAFRVPDGDASGQTYKSFSYAANGMAFNPAKNSLFLVGHVLSGGLIAELSTETPKITDDFSALNKATLLQPFTDATNGTWANVGSGDSYTGGLLTFGNELLFSTYIRYDANGTQTKSHWRLNTDLSKTTSVTGPWKVRDPQYPESVTTDDGVEHLNMMGRAGWVSGYMCDIPQAWQATLGGSAFAGNFGMSIVGRTSFGPTLTAFKPADVGPNDALGYRVVGYPADHTTLGPWTGTPGVVNPLYNSTSHAGGCLFPEGTRSVLFFGQTGAGDHCYGYGTTNPALHHTPYPGIGKIDNDGRMADANGFGPEGVWWCYDPIILNSKGQHGYPYVFQVWAYDALDLAKVANREMFYDDGAAIGPWQPWQVVPYAIWHFTLPYTPVNSPNTIVGVAYDKATGRIFLSPHFSTPVGSQPVIHVFQVTP